jgi:predicted ATPase
MWSDVELLTALSGQERRVQEIALFRLADEALLVPCRGGFRFAHDRIREAASALVCDEQRTQVHERMLRYLQATLTAEERAERIFELAQHMNQAVARLSESDRIECLEVNRAAGRRALAGGAGATACSYLAAARALLRAEDWSEREALAFDITMLGAESAFQAGRLDETLQLLDTIDEARLCPADFSRVAQQRVQVFDVHESFDEGVEYLLGALARLGVRWPRRPSTLRLLLAIGAVRLQLRRPALEEGLPPDPAPQRHLPADQLIHRAGALLMRGNPPLFALAICQALVRALRPWRSSGEPARASAWRASRWPGASGGPIRSPTRTWGS